MWQSLVTIGQETSEIRRQTSKKIETSAVKYSYNGRRPASWWAAITTAVTTTTILPESIILSIATMTTLAETTTTHAG